MAECLGLWTQYLVRAVGFLGIVYTEGDCMVVIDVNSTELAWISGPQIHTFTYFPMYIVYIFIVLIWL